VDGPEFNPQYCLEEEGEEDREREGEGEEEEKSGRGRGRRISRRGKFRALILIFNDTSPCLEAALNAHLPQLLDALSSFATTTTGILMRPNSYHCAVCFCGCTDF
jgi:hypothetical protein